jgi:aspartate/methionine/tyrosine aminotransferase
MQDSRRLRAVQTPIIPVIADLIRAHPGTISLGQGVVNYGPPAAAAEEIGRLLSDPEKNKYQATDGLPELLQAISLKLAAENRIHVGDANATRLMVTAGGNQAFFNIVLGVLDPGDEVILPTPFYFNHEMAIVMANARPVLVTTDRNFDLDLDAIRAAITPLTRAIVTVSPNNPSGVVYSEASLRAVNRICADHGLFHISDEAYEYFVYDEARHFSPASIPGASAHTISLFSMSKAYGFASWRIGWMVFPACLENALRKVQDTIIICPPVVSQYAALGALSAGGTFVRGKVQALAKTRAFALQAVAELEREGLAEIPAAKGALYFLLRLRSDMAPLAYATRLIREHAVAAIPGDAFGLAQGCHLRVAYGALQPNTAAEGVGRLVEGVKALNR